jgi:putative transposase
MANKPKYLRAAAERAVQSMLTYQQEHGELPRHIVAQHAATTGYSERHLHRLLKEQAGATPAKEPGFAVTEDVITAVFACCGRISQAHRRLEREGMELPSESTFRRRIEKAMGADQLAYARGGSSAMRDKQVYLAGRFDHRNQAVQLDHAQLPIWVVPRGHRHAVKPWITAVMDSYSRYVLSWVITFGRPTAEEVRAALVSAITLRVAPDGETLVGGKPSRAMWDRGLEFLSDLITESCLRLDILPVALPAYTPQLKGRIERFWRFFKDDCLSPLPGYDDGPQDLRGNNAIASKAMGEDDFLIKVADWMDWYTTKHRIKKQRTPLEAWKADGTPLDTVPPEQLWVDMLLAKSTARVGKNGIRFDGVDWTPLRGGLVGRSVEIRYLPHDRTFIEVFVNGEHYCTAHPQLALTADEEDEQIELRQKSRLEAQKRFTTANRQRSSEVEGDVYRLDKAKNGKRAVKEPPKDDLLEGGEAALRDIAGECDDPQQTMF